MGLALVHFQKYWPLRQNRPIPGIIAHDLAMGYHEPVKIKKDTLSALLFPKVNFGKCDQLYKLI